MAVLNRYKVTMRSVGLGANGELQTHEATDHVDIAHLDAYVADAKTRWQSVTVSDEIDHGPGGEHGAYKIHPHMITKQA